MDRPICVSVLVVVARGRICSEVMRQMRSNREGAGVCFHVSAAPDPRTHMFYEVYVDGDVVASHKNTKHYAAWDAFRNGGGIERQHNTVCEGVFDRPDTMMPDPRRATRDLARRARRPSQLRARRARQRELRFRVQGRGSEARDAHAGARGFGHPRGLKEDPIRPGTLSNFARADCGT